MTTQLVLLGACAGLGIALVLATLARPAANVAGDMRRYEQSADLPLEAPSSTLVSLGTSIEHLVASKERRSQRACDLAVTDRTTDRHFVVLAVSTLLGASLPIVLAGLLAATAWHLPAWGILALGGLGAVGGVAGPTIELRRSAAQARERFLSALSCWLELVALAQAGGMGVEGALEAAGRISSDAGFSRIRRALERSRHSGTAPWDELARLGSEIGIDELGELAASLGLAGSEGARVRASLSAKSESMRRRQMSETESRANATTERLFLPSIVLMVGFLVFLMFPAGVSLSHVL